MKIYQPVSPESLATMTTQDIRDHFLMENLWAIDAATFHYVDDRMIVGGLFPIKQLVSLTDPSFFSPKEFLEHREVAFVNLGGEATVNADGVIYRLKRLDVLYLGKGQKDVVVASVIPDHPAKIYVVSTVAEVSHPNQLIQYETLTPLSLGTSAEANTRSLYKIIHPNGVKSSRLMLGMTFLKPGSVWNTMPPHTHLKRMETYLYFDMAPKQIVVHLLGEPHATKHLIVKNEQAVISPNYSIHSGVGTQAYAFIWAMSGENQSFDDMQKIEPENLK